MKPPIEIPGLGTVAHNGFWYASGPIPVRALGGQLCEIGVDGYEDDPNKEDFHTAIANFLSIGPEVLKDVEGHVFQYYQDIKEEREDEDFDDEDSVMDIESASDVWRRVRLSRKPLVRRRRYGNKEVYVSLDCGCDWEEEHGLQIVLKNGLKVNKLGAYNGHFTNSDAYKDPALEDVIYRGR